LVREAARFGTTVGAVELDWATVVRRQHAIVEELQPSVASLERIGVRVYLGDGRFEDARTVTVGGGRVAGERVVIVAGSTPAVPRRILEARGLVAHPAGTATVFARRRADLTMRCSQAGTAGEVQADQVCVAVGRRFRPDLVGAEALGLDTGPLGLRVTPHLRT